MAANILGSINIPADQCKIVASDCSGFTITKEEFIAKELGEQYEEIMHHGFVRNNETHWNDRYINTQSMFPLDKDKI